MLLVVLLLLTAPALSERLLLGYLTGSQRRPGDREYQRPGLTISGAISLAVDEVNNGQLGSRGHSLDFVVAETFGEETSSIRQVAALWTRNVSAYIGPQETCVHEGRMAAAFNLPIISYYCTDYETTDKRNFPTFARTRPPDTQISKSVASVLLAFNWTQVTFLYFNSEDHEAFSKIASTILSVLEASGVKVLFTKTWSTQYHHGYSDNPFHSLVQQTFRDSRIYLILGHTYEHIGLIVAMEELKLFDNGEYWVVGADIEQYDGDAPEKYIRGLLRDQSDPLAVRGFRSYLGVVPSPPRGYDNFSLLVNAYMERPPFNFPNPVDIVGGVKRITAEAAYLYDAVQLYAKAVLEILEEGGSPYNGSDVINHIKGRHYHSAMGYMVYMDENGDAAGNYTILGRRPHHLTPGEFGLYPIGLFTLAGTTPEVRLSEQIDWGVRGCPPISEPPCGFRGEKCITHTMEILGGVVGGVLAIMTIVLLLLYRNWRYEQELDSLLWKVDYKDIDTHTMEILGGVVGGVLAIMTIVLLLLYRNWRYEQELDSLLWKVDYKDIQMNDEQSNSKINRASHPLIRTSQVSLSSNPDADFRYSSIYCQIGVYRGRVLAVKTVAKKTVDITRTMKKELKTLRDLRHDNLNAFIGACTEPPHICIVTEYCTRGSIKLRDLRHDNLNAFIGACTEPPHICIVTEYCTRGSLKDILENEDVKLDNMFIASLVADIIRGLIYLQDSPLHYHGNLKSSNCLVDSRWVVKLADFGLSQLKGDEETHHHYLQHTFYSPQDETCRCKCEGLLYRAPELLRITTSSPGPGSQKGDVYSFGIILYELHSRKGPFGDSTGLNTAEILRRVIHYSGQGPPFRPPLELLENSFDFVRDCLKECWQENPDDRPEIKTVRAKLRPMRKGMKPNIFDNMIAMMEKYANNLEALVDERTDQLVEEKKKTEALLYEMLPRYVAEQLKRGHKVQAESFDCVTIYFSDIVGFTHMSAESTPLQVVDFLNDLYTCFDSTIENFDVYKVETIGDAYMVVSGLPVRNGDQHAGEIATMSLHLLEAVRRFHIRHRPNDSLQLRIGIHSGPVCAGVVGLKMPRYCLFGDTVNTTSRMESTGTALRIHCSSACKALLDRLKGYKLVERGTVDMKGKGEMLTYWLLGEEHEHQIKRTEEREKRRAEQLSRLSTKKGLKNQQDSNGCAGVPRSSLKNRNLTLTPSPRNLSRCASLESPKKLRFASNHTLEFTSPNPYQKCSRDPLLEVINDNSPSKRTLSQSGSEMGDAYCVNHLSASCPCIENFSPPPGKLPPLTLGESGSNSEPTLCASAPVSPSDAESPLVLSVTRSPTDEVRTPLLPSHQLRAH